MEIRKLELILENGEIANCQVMGKGKRIGYIVGPGSFYLKFLSILEDQYTLISADSLWTYGKASSLKNLEVISKVTKDYIKQRDHFIIKALKKYYNDEKIDGFGFSAPGAFLFEEAMDYPDDFENIIGTGIGLTELDPTFSKTNTMFYKTASNNRKDIYEKYQNEFQKLKPLMDGLISLNENTFFNFDIKDSTKFPLKPHKKFIAETISNVPKLLFDFSNHEKSKSTIIDHWKHNLLGEHLDKRMQEHFFVNIYPSLKPYSALLELAKYNKKILLIYGKSDFITPISAGKINKLVGFSNIELNIIDECGHMPYKETPFNFKVIIRNFNEIRMTSKLNAIVHHY